MTRYFIQCGELNFGTSPHTKYTYSLSQNSIHRTCTVLWKASTFASAKNSDKFMYTFISHCQFLSVLVMMYPFSVTICVLNLVMKVRIMNVILWTLDVLCLSRRWMWAVISGKAFESCQLIIMDIFFQFKGEPHPKGVYLFLVYHIIILCYYCLFALWIVCSLSQTAR